jgi:serine/threonine-protein kinase
VAVGAYAAPLAPGYRLDRYELLCPLAHGGMASVWAGRLRGKHGFEKLVAVKMIRPEFAPDAKFQQMFLDEARIAAGIAHANVAQILDLGEQRGLLYLVMELVDGESLSRLMKTASERGARVPVGIGCRIVADVCAGLAAAHDLRDREGRPLGVVHRDVSPQNVLVTTRGIPKLIDFGVAKARDRLSEESSAGTFKGKVQYMAPEQILGHELDARADVWGIGAVLYHVVAGRPPFDEGSSIATLQKVMRGGAPAPLPRDVPGPIAELVLRCLRHDPETRVGSAAALRAELETAMRVSGILATTDDVASYYAALLSDAERARRQALEAAVAAADRRAADEAEGGFGDLEESLARLSPEQRANLARSLTSEPPAASRSGPPAATPSEGPNSSLGGATLGLPPPPPLPVLASSPPPPRRTAILPALALLCIAALGGIVILRVVVPAPVPASVEASAAPTVASPIQVERAGDDSTPAPEPTAAPPSSATAAVSVKPSPSASAPARPPRRAPPARRASDPNKDEPLLPNDDGF